MTSTRCLLAAIALIVGLANGVAHAQERLPASIIGATAALSSEQKRVVSDEFCAPLMSKLVDGEDGEVADARKKLIAPLSGASPLFLADYRKLLGTQLHGGFESERVIVRINLMIVATALKDLDSVSLLIRGLKDQNPACRYCAAQAIASLTGSNLKPPAEQQKTLLDALAEAMRHERYEQVLRQLILALVELTIPEAMTQVFEAINQRVEEHAKQPDLSLTSEIQGLRVLIRQMVKSPPDPDQLKLGALVNARYFRLCARLLDKGELGANAEADCITMIGLTDENLKWLVVKAVKTPLPPEVTDVRIKVLIANKDWAAVRYRAEVWANLLVERLETDQKKLEIRSETADEGNSRSEPEARI